MLLERLDVFDGSRCDTSTGEGFADSFGFWVRDQAGTGRDEMLKLSIYRVVDLCTRRAWLVIALAATLAAVCGIYTAQHFAVTTDTTALFPPDLPWAKRAFQYMRAFPQPGIIVVVEAPTPEDVEEATTRLSSVLAKRKDRIRAVYQPQSGSFFERNGLLYLPTGEVARLTGGLTKAGPLLASLSADPSLRGALDFLSMGLAGVAGGVIPLDDLTRPLDMAADTAQAVLAGRPTAFSWRILASGQAARPTELRRFIEVEPILDYHLLEPGRAATDAIARTVRDLKLGQDYQAKVRQTGLVPINDDGFATLTKHAGVNAVVSLCACILDLVAGAALGKDHPGRGRQHRRRSRGICGCRAVAGRRAQPHLGGLLRSVCRPRH